MSLSAPILLAMLVVVTVIGGVYLYGLSRKWGILLPYIGMFLFSAMALPVDWHGQVRTTVWLPVQSKRSVLFLICGLAGFLALLTHIRRTSGKRLSVSAAFLVLAGLYGAMLRFFHGGPMDGTMSVLFSFATLVPILFTPMVYIDEPDDLLKLMRAVVITNCIWLGMTFVQLLVNPAMLTTGIELRFVGLLSNPQHSGVLMPFFFVISLWVMLNETRRNAMLLMGIVGINALLLLWTGSRTGMGMAVIGLSATLYSRAGRAILLLPIAGLFGYIGLKLMVDVLGISLIGIERMTSTADTRSSAWMKLINTAMQNPAIGVGVDDAEKSENSWLYGFASYGLGMFVLLLILTIAGTVEIIKSMTARFRVAPRHRSSLDFMVGILLMYFAGGVFEGYMISRVSPTICVFLLFAMANVNVRRMLLGQQHSTEPLYEEWGDSEDYAPYDDDELDDYADPELGYAR